MKKCLVAVSVLALLVLLAAGCGSTKSPTPAPTLSLEILEPQDEAIVNVSRIAVSGKTEADAVVSINGIIADVDYQGMFTAEVNLDAGPNVIEVVASDFYGNEQSVVLAVVYATALPLTVTEPLNESVVTSQPLMVRGVTNTDAVVSVNGKIVSVDASGSFNESVTLDVGPNFIEVLASDFDGNSATVTITVIYSP